MAELTQNAGIPGFRETHDWGLVEGRMLPGNGGIRPTNNNGKAAPLVHPRKAHNDAIKFSAELNYCLNVRLPGTLSAWPQSRDAGISFSVISSSPRFTVIVVSSPTLRSAIASV